MPGWLPLIIAYSTFGFMYLLILGFLTTRLEDDSLWTSVDAAFAFTLVGLTMIFGGPTFVMVAQRIGLRFTVTLAFAMWPVCVGVILTGYPYPVYAACIGIGFLFGAIPTLMTLYVVENTTAQDYGPSFAAATLSFGIAQTISPPWRSFGRPLWIILACICSRWAYEYYWSAGSAKASRGGYCQLLVSGLVA
jgi:predicted MFS family arabinose efflux permease